MRKSIVHNHICRTAVLIGSILLSTTFTTPVLADKADDPEFVVTNSEDINSGDLESNGKNVDHKTQDTLAKPKKEKKKKEKAKDKNKDDADDTETEASTVASDPPAMSISALTFNPVSLSTTTNITKRLDYAVDLAKKLSKMGIPYVYGGNSIITGLDCSALTLYLYSHIGIALPRTAADQAGCLTTIPLSQAIPGDLLFWGNPGCEYHVGIYIGNGQFVAAPAPGQTVSVQNISGAFYPTHAGTVRSVKK